MHHHYLCAHHLHLLFLQSLYDIGFAEGNSGIKAKFQMTLQILCGDFAEVSWQISPKSIPLIITSPPYDALRRYGGHSFVFESMASAIDRVLAPGGILCWNMNDSVIDGSETLTSCKQKIFFHEHLGLRIHDTMIYEKANGSKPDRWRYNACMEYIFVFSKGRPRVFNPIKDKPNVTAGKPCFGKHTMRQVDGSMKVRNDRKVSAEFGTRSNVWKGLTRGQEDMGKELKHPAMMPKWLARDLILSYSNPGDVVCDPMAGSFTVCCQALSVGRKTIGCDINPEYCELGRQTCSTITPGFEL